MTTVDKQGASAEHGLRYVSILDFLVVLAKHKKFLVRFVLGAVLVAVVVLFLVLPRWYKSTAVVMPPKQQSALGLLSSLKSATAPLRSLGIGASNDQLSQFQTIVRSRRCYEDVITHFDLQRVYASDNMEEAVKELDGNLNVSLGKEDASLEIAVFDTDPSRAAAMANYFVEVLNKIYVEMSISEARGNREFLEIRYRKNLSDLKAAEESLKTFQQKYGVYSIPEQMKAAVEAAATLQSQVFLKEVQLGILDKTTSPENFVRQQTELELNELRRQLGQLKTGSLASGKEFKLFSSFDQAPQIGLLYFRYYREVEIQGKLLELLLPLFEQAKIEEQRNTPSLLVLDTAVPAVKASKPKRLLITALVGVGSVIVGILVAAILEFLSLSSSAMGAADHEKLKLIREELHFRRLFK
jgi:uncharacterized protein involved in exopolysaccharide biosynthesis